MACCINFKYIGKKIFISKSYKAYLSLMHTLFYYHLVASIVHISSFVFLVQLAPQENETGYQLVVPYATYTDGIASYMYSEVFGKISIATVLLINEAVTAISHLVGLLGFALYRQRMVEDQRHLEIVRRYVEYAVTAALLEVVIYLLVGGQDANLLLAIVLTNIVIQVLGYMLERTQNVQRQVYLNLSAFALLMVPIVSLLTSGLQDELFVGISVYYSILYMLFGLHSLLHILSEGWRGFVDKDAGFIVLGIVAKEILTWMVVALQAKVLGDKVDAANIGKYVDIDALLVWLPLGGILTAVVAIVVSSRFSIQDGYETI